MRKAFGFFGMTIGGWLLVYWRVGVDLPGVPRQRGGNGCRSVCRAPNDAAIAGLVYRPRPRARPRHGRAIARFRYARRPGSGRTGSGPWSLCTTVFDGMDVDRTADEDPIDSALASLGGRAKAV